MRFNFNSQCNRTIQVIRQSEFSTHSPDTRIFELYEAWSISNLEITKLTQSVEA